MNKLFYINPFQRWGNWNLDQIKKHSFFKQFDWDNIKNISDVIVKKHVLNQINLMNEKLKQSQQHNKNLQDKSIIENGPLDETLKIKTRIINKSSLFNK